MKNFDWLRWSGLRHRYMRINPIGLILVIVALTFSAGSLAVEYASAELLQAVSARDHDRVRQLVSDGLQFIEKPSPNQRTPLFVAAQNNDLQTLELLVKAGANANETAPSGVSLLMANSYSGPMTTVAFLLRLGADPDYAQRGGGMTALMAACFRGKTENARLLLDAGADPNVQTDDGRSALFNAISGGHEDLVRLLLKRGADPNLNTSPNSSLIGFAVKQANKPIVSQLLAAGADVNGGGRGHSPLYWAIDRGDADLALLLLNAGADPNPNAAIVQAAQRGMTQVVKKMIETGCDLNQPGPRKRTALHMATGAGDLKMVMMLVEAGANLRAKDASGFTPSETARRRGAEAVAKYLDNQTQ